METNPTESEFVPARSKVINMLSLLVKTSENMWLPNEPQYNKTNKMTCAPSEDSDQPGHPPSLISLCYALKNG